MDEVLSRVWEQLLGRTGGPFHFRFILQPIMASLFAVRSGLNDAKAQRPAYLWAVVFRASERRDLIKAGWKDIGKVFIVAFVLDGIYQVVELGWLYPLQALFVAFVLAIVPYVLIRGPVARIARRASPRHTIT